MNKLVIFDLDGTLLDTLGDLCDAVNYAIGTVGRPPRTRDEIRTYIGNGTRKMIERALYGFEDFQDREHVDDALIEKCIAEYTEYYGAHYNVKTYAYEGILHCLELLIKNGICAGVVTNKLDRMSQKLCREHFGDVFFGIVGDVPGKKRKPDPSKVLKMMADAQADKCVIVGDSTVDVQTAKNAGLPCIAVTWGFNPEAMLVNACPEYIAHDYLELIDCLEKSLDAKLVD